MKGCKTPRRSISKTGTGCCTTARTGGAEVGRWRQRRLGGEKFVWERRSERGESKSKIDREEIGLVYEHEKLISISEQRDYRANRRSSNAITHNSARQTDGKGHRILETRASLRTLAPLKPGSRRLRGDFLVSRRYCCRVYGRYIVPVSSSAAESIKNRENREGLRRGRRERKIAIHEC